MPEQKPGAPRWAGRVPKYKIARIYEDDARGIHDQDLIDDVAYTLLARCESMLQVEEARLGRATCPVCAATVEHAAQRGCSLECKHCGWSGSWDDYRGSFDGLHLIAPGLQPFCREYVRRLPAARTPRARMYWIDWLIHRCHWEGTALPGQPGAASLIEGRAQDVNAFLSALTAGTWDPQGVGDPSQYWDAAQLEQICKWREAADRRQRKRAGSEAQGDG
jgi:hypothetical protein